ncbi:MAG: nucleoside triphosphate pyrophosphohydrolase [bacterium]|nr:nucleoside triphosphate pyrophosphohydrolase [bacterium]
MPARRYRKLVRDRIPRIIEARGLRCEVRRLGKAPYARALKEKIREEAAELAAARGRDAVLNELVDLQELVDAHRRLLGVGGRRFRELVRRKRSERGGFSRRLFLESAG